MNPVLHMMLNNLIKANPNAFNKAQEMCKGKSDKELKQIFMNLAQTQGRDMNELQQLCAMFNIKI